MTCAYVVSKVQQSRAFLSARICETYRSKRDLSSKIRTLMGCKAIE